MGAEFDRDRLPDLESYCAGRGIALRGLGAERRGNCPLAEHSHTGSLAVNVSRGLWQCMGGCGGGDVLALHRAITGLDFLDAARELGAIADSNGGDGQMTAARAPAVRRQAEPDHDALADQRRKVEKASDLWRQTEQLERSCPGGSYLVDSRGALMPPADGDLRWLPSLELFGFSGPALVGRISAPANACRAIGLHLTWLRREGERWARGERRYLGRKAGGCVRLWPDEAVAQGLAIAEGIETALCAAHMHRPIWAALDAGNLSQFPLLPGIDTLTVFADRDLSGAGQAAAADCAERWLQEGRHAVILASATMGHDIADEAVA